MIIGMGELSAQDKISSDKQFNGIIKALNEWNFKSAVDELVKISTSSNPEDEGAFYFFKANITLCTYIQVDSTHENNALSYVDSSVKYFERAIATGSSVFFPSLYIQTPQQGLDTCAAIINKRAKQYYLKDDLLKAMTLYEKIIEFKSDDATLLNAALTAMKLTSYPKARTYFTRSLELNPKNEKAWIGLTETYKRINDTANAINTAFTSLQYDSTNHNLLINLYNIAIFSNKKETLENAIYRLENSNVNSKYTPTLANLYYITKDFVKAEPYYIASSSNQTEDAKCEIMLKFYFNWYLHLYSSALLNTSKGNSESYSSDILANKKFISKKIEPYITKYYSNNQLKKIVDFLNSELL